MPINQPHQRYLDLLFSRVEQVRYPSHHILARIEAAIADRETAERYVNVLLSLAEGERHPSLHMIDRAAHVMKQISYADILEDADR